MITFQTGKGVLFSRAPLVGSVRFERLKLVLWFRYRLPVQGGVEPCVRGVYAGLPSRGWSTTSTSSPLQA